MVIGIHHRHRWHHRDWRPQIERTVKCPSTKAPATDSHQHTWAGNESNYSAEKASFRHLSAIVTAQSTASPLIHSTVSRSVFVSGSQLVGNVFSADRTHLHGFNFLSASLHFINFRVFFQFSSQIESSLRTRFITCASWHTTRKLLMSSTMYWLPFADNLSPWQMCFLSSLKPVFAVVWTISWINVARHWRIFTQKLFFSSTFNLSCTITRSAQHTNWLHRTKN